LVNDKQASIVQGGGSGGRAYAVLLRHEEMNGVTISAFNFCRDGEDTMRIFGYLGFLIAWLLAPAPTAIAVADTASVQAVASDGTQSHLAEEEEDLLNIWD
jgi:hypothetical protein